MTTQPHRLSATPSARILLAVVALLAAFVLYQVAEFSLAAASAELAVARATEATTTEPNGVETHLAQAKSVADELKQKNLFVPPPPNENPVREVLGILGNEALINGKWYKAGDRVGDAKILVVEPTRIRVSWNGQEKELSPLGSTGGGSGGGPASGRVRPPGAPPGPGPARVGTEERAAVRERLREASPEEREKLQEAMRQRSAARRR